MSETQAAAPLDATVIHNSLQAAITDAVTTHVAEVASQGRSVLTALNAGVVVAAAPVNNVSGHLNGMEDRLAGLLADAHDTIHDIVDRLETGPHAAAVVAAIVGLLVVGGAIVEAAHRFLL